MMGGLNINSIKIEAERIVKLPESRAADRAADLIASCGNMTCRKEVAETLQNAGFSHLVRAYDRAKKKIASANHALAVLGKANKGRPEFVNAEGLREFQASTGAANPRGILTPRVAKLLSAEARAEIELRHLDAREASEQIWHPEVAPEDIGDTVRAARKTVGIAGAADENPTSEQAQVAAYEHVHRGIKGLPSEILAVVRKPEPPPANALSTQGRGALALSAAPTPTVTPMTSVPIPSVTPLPDDLPSPVFAASNRDRARLSVGFAW
jgi:hypothetical protein